jgi:hypothetical protein
MKLSRRLNPTFWLPRARPGAVCDNGPLSWSETTSVAVSGRLDLRLTECHMGLGLLA